MLVLLAALCAALPASMAAAPADTHCLGPYVDAATLSRRWGISRTFLYTDCLARGLPSIKVGRLRRFPGRGDRRLVRGTFGDRAS